MQAVFPEKPQELAGLWKLMAHPRRHHRRAARYRQPRQGVGQRPAEFSAAICNDPTSLRCASGIVEPSLDRLPGLSLRRPNALPKLEEQFVQGTVQTQGLGGT